MLKKLAINLLWLIFAFGLFVGALIGNCWFAQRYLLRLDNPEDPYIEIRKHMTPVARPLFFDCSKLLYNDFQKNKFIKGVGLDPNINLPSNGNPSFDIGYIMKMIPYPAPVAYIRGEGIYYCSFGYIGADDRYHQITTYGGESDSTPSFLVRKARGIETGWGDYFVNYTVYISKDMKDHPQILDSRGVVTQWKHPNEYPDIDRIDWSTYAGGSYNGFEEIKFSIWATVVEWILLGLGIFLWRRKSHTRQAT